MAKKERRKNKYYFQIWKYEAHASRNAEYRIQIYIKKCVCAVFCTLFLWTVISVISGCGKASPPSKALSEEYNLYEVICLSEEFIECKKVIVHGVINQNIRIKNIGNRSIKLISYHSSCGCLVITNNVTSIEPGHEAVVGIRVKFDKKGKYYQAIMLCFEAAGQRAYKMIRVRADVK